MEMQCWKSGLGLLFAGFKNGFDEQFDRQTDAERVAREDVVEIFWEGLGVQIDFILFRQSVSISPKWCVFAIGVKDQNNSVVDMAFRQKKSDSEPPAPKPMLFGQSHEMDELLRKRLLEQMSTRPPVPSAGAIKGRPKFDV
jgi:hypothetical protein